MTVLIIQIVAAMVVANVSSVERSERLDRAAQEIVVAARYARMLAMSAGEPAGLEFDAATQRVRVWRGAAFTTATNSQMPGGVYVMDLGNKDNIEGVRLASLLLSNVTTTPHRVTFSALGATSNNGYITLSYGGATRTVVIPIVGDPKIQ